MQQLQTDTSPESIDNGAKSFAIREHFIKSLHDLAQVIAAKERMPDVFLGQVLLHAKAIKEEQLDQALKRQSQEFGKHLGRILVEMGVVTPEQINTALAAKFNIPFVNLDEYEVAPSTLSRVPADLALQYNALPLGEIGGKLVVAMENPLDTAGIDALRFNTNINIEPVRASSQGIALALSKYYSKFDENEALEDMKMDPVEEPATGAEALHVIEQQAKKKPVVRLLNAIVLQAVIRGASDINVRPEKDRVNVFYRVDGKLQFSRSLHKSLLPALVSRVKIIGQMDIAERRLPQDGHARLIRGRKIIDLRISIIPTVDGESVVIRILDRERGLRPLSELGLRAHELALTQQLISRPHGLFLVTGPTGSGKSTTLYALLNEIKKYNPHVLTVEDPVEYSIEGIEQVQVAPVKGNTFSSILRHFLRHDPDVIMVGEIRDQETAKIATKASLTGHLVLSTLHTNDAASTIARLIDMGIEPYLLSTTLLGVMAQRLVRLNCRRCTSEVDVDPVIERVLHLKPGEKFFRGEGCLACNYTGYQGRTTVAELLNVNPQVAELINAEATKQAIESAAVAGGMVRLTENALQLARQGRTSLEEVLAVRLD